MEPTFAAFFLRKLLGRANTPDDLPSLDGVLAASLRKLRHYDGTQPRYLSLRILSLTLSAASSFPAQATLTPWP